jgi:hypothetical protein
MQIEKVSAYFFLMGSTSLQQWQARIGDNTALTVMKLLVIRLTP